MTPHTADPRRAITDAVKLVIFAQLGASTAFLTIISALVTFLPCIFVSITANIRSPIPCVFAGTSRAQVVVLWVGGLTAIVKPKTAST